MISFYFDLQRFAKLYTSKSGASVASGDSTISAASITGVLAEKHGGTDKDSLSSVTVGAANKLSTAKDFIVSLGSTNTTQFDGSSSVTLGIAGILSSTHGGTGKNNLGEVSVGTADKANSATTAASLSTARALQVSLNNTVAANFQGNTEVKNIGVQGTLQPAQGGTGINTIPSMLVNLSSTNAADIFTKEPRPGVTGKLPISLGGTGQTTAAGVRNAIGLGNTTGALEISVGGTGATKLDDIKANKDNLGNVISTTYATKADMEVDLGKKLDKLTHEYSKDISVTAANAIQIGAFPCNETGLSVIAIEIYGATTTASHCIAVLYANAVTNASTGTINWKVYNDYNNSIKDKLYLQRNTNNKINIYYKPAVAARLIFHVIATNLQDAPLNSDMFKSLALPNAASIKPDTNTLTDTFLKISGDTLAGNLTTNGDIILSEGKAVKTSESNFSGLKHLKTNTGSGSNLLLQGAQQMIVAAGEVGTDLYNNSLKGANSIPADGEQLYLLSDREITIGAGYQSGAKVNKIVLNSVGTAIDNNVTVTGDISVSGSFKGNLKGNADTASKFNTSKTITLSGAVTGSVSSQDDWAITAERKSCVLGQNNINSTFTTDEQIKPWYKVASCSITTANTDVEATFLVEDTYSSSNFGILKIRARYGSATNASNYIDTDKSMIKWLCNLGYDPNDFKLVLPTTKNPTVELWTRIATAYHCRRFTVISEGKRKDFDPSVWTLYSAISDGQQASIPTAGTKKTSELPNFDLNNIQINNIELPTVGSFVGKSVKGSPETFSGLSFIEVYHTIDSTANPSVRTDNEKYGYSVLLQGANKLIVAAGEAGYKAFNSVMAGDNVIENDNVEDLHLLADNKVIIGTGYNTVSVGSNYTFDKNTLILPDKAIIRDNLSTNSWSGIKFVRKTSTNNNGADVLVQGAGQLIISAGDHGEDIATGTLTNGNKTETIVSNHDENLYLVADKDIIVFSNIEQGIVNRKSFSFKQNGTFAIGTGGALTVPAATIDSASIPSANIKGNITLKSNMYMPAGTRVGNSLNNASWSGMSLAAENANGLGSDIIIQGASKLIVAAGEAANNVYNNSNANSNSIPSGDNSENLYLLADKNVIIGSNYGTASLGVNATLDTSGALTVNKLNTNNVSIKSNVTIGGTTSVKGNVTIGGRLHEEGNSAVVGLKSSITSGTTKQWFKVAESPAASKGDYLVVFLVEDTYYNRKSSGILCVHARANNENQWDEDNSSVKWLINSGFPNNEFVLLLPTSVNSKAELWTKITQHWSNKRFTIFSEGLRIDHNKIWTLFNNGNANTGDRSDITELTSLTSQYQYLQPSNSTLSSPILSNPKVTNDINVSGSVIINNASDLKGNATVNPFSYPALIVGGDYSLAHIEIDSNEIHAKTALGRKDANSPYTVEGAPLTFNNEGGRVHIGPGGLKINTTTTNQVTVGQTLPSSLQPALVIGQYDLAHMEVSHNKIQAKAAVQKSLSGVAGIGINMEGGNIYLGKSQVTISDGGVDASNTTVTANTFKGSLSGNALTSSSLKTARALQVSLSNTSSANFQGNVDVKTIGVQGILKVNNGGTGVNNLNSITVGGATRDCLGNVISSTYAKLAGSTFTGPVTFQKPIVLSNVLNLSNSLRTSVSTPALVIGTLSGNHLEFDNNEIRAKTKWNKGTTLFLNSGSGEESSQGGLVDVGNGGLNVKGNATINGTLHLTNTVDAGLGKATSPALIIGEGLDKQHIEINGNEILSKSDNNTTSDLYINTSGDKGAVIGKGGLIIKGGGLTVKGGGVLADKQTITANAFKGNLTGLAYKLRSFTCENAATVVAKTASINSAQAPTDFANRDIICVYFAYPNAAVNASLSVNGHKSLPIRRYGATLSANTAKFTTYNNQAVFLKNINDSYWDIVEPNTELSSGNNGILPVANGGTGANNLANITVGAATKDGSGSVIANTYAKLTGNNTLTGTLTLSKTTNLSGTANNSPALIVGGVATGAHLELDANEVHAKANGTSVNNLYLNNDGGVIVVGPGGLSVKGGTTVNSDHGIYYNGKRTYFIDGIIPGGAAINVNNTKYGAIFNAPTKNYRLALGTRPNNDDILYLSAAEMKYATSKGGSVNNHLATHLKYDVSNGNLSIPGDLYIGSVKAGANSSTANITLATIAPSSSTKGQIYYNTNVNEAYVYDGSRWLSITG